MSLNSAAYHASCVDVERGEEDVVEVGGRPTELEAGRGGRVLYFTPHLYILHGWIDVVVVYHVTIVAIGHGLLKNFWPLVIGCVLRTAGSQLFETMQTRLLR